MSARTRLLQALSLQKPDQVPIAPAYPGGSFRDYAFRFYLERYRPDIMRNGTVQLNHALDTQVWAEAYYLAYAICQQRFDWMETFCGPSEEWARDTVLEWGEEGARYRNLRTGQVEALNQDWVYRPASISYLNASPATADKWHVAHHLWSREQISDQLPVVSAEELGRGGVFDLSRKIVRDYGAAFVTVARVPSPYWSTYSLLGFKGMMEAMYDSPALFHSLIERRMMQYLEVVRGYVNSGVDAIWIEECFSSAELISSEHFKGFALAHLTPFAAEIQRLGGIPILYYLGHVVPRLSLIKESGVTCIAVEDSKKDFVVNIEDVIRAVGEGMCVFGNVDTTNVILGGTPEMIREEVARQLQAGAGAQCFVLSTASPFRPGTHPRHIDVFVEAGRRQWE